MDAKMNDEVLNERLNQATRILVFAVAEAKTVLKNFEHPSAEVYQLLKRVDVDEVVPATRPAAEKAEAARKEVREVADALRKLAESLEDNTAITLLGLADRLAPAEPLPVVFKTALPFYTDADLKHPSFIAIIAEAKALWTKRCAEEFAHKGDWGSCVLGAGFTVAVKHTGKRKAVDEFVIRSSEVCRAQGSCVWESSYREVKAFLESRGLKVDYEHGFMD